MRGVFLLGIVTMLGAAQAPAAQSDGVARVPISFSVENRNGSALPCRSDGEAFTVRGTIVGPERVLSAPPEDLGATLYLHEFSFGEFFWAFDRVPGYDYADALARRGHVSVIVDRVGYDASDHPPGRDVCLGSHADMAAQMIQALRQGGYAGQLQIAFANVVLAGHSVGGAIAELTLTSFDTGASGLVLFAWADRGFTSRTIAQSLHQGADCAAGGEPAEPGGAPGYAYFGRTEADFHANVFADTDPRVIAAVTPMRNRDPCGDNSSLAQISIVNGMRASRIDVPVLILFGDADANFQTSAADDQARAFSGSPSVTVKRFASAGHALTLERSAPQVQRAVADWLGPVVQGKRVSRPMPATGTPTWGVFLGIAAIVAGVGMRFSARSVRGRAR